MRKREYREHLIETEGVCFYCSFDLRRHRYLATLDHIVPRSQGGTNHVSNLRLSCRRCNEAKSDNPEFWLLFHISGCVLAETNRRAILRKIARKSLIPVHTFAGDDWREPTPAELRRAERKRQRKETSLTSHNPPENP